MTSSQITTRSVRAACSFAIAAIVGCSSTTEPKSELRVTTTVNASTLRTGDSVLVTVTVLNAAAKTDTINANPCPVAFSVETAAGVLVGPPAETCDGSYVIKELKSGQSYVTSSWWKGDGYTATASGVQPLPAGRYTIRARFWTTAAQTNGVPIDVVR